MSQHICGLTGKVFDSAEAYYDHVSEVTGFTPRDLEHQGTRGIMVAKEALRRTGKLTKTREAELDAKLDEVRGQDIDHSLMAAKRDRIEARNLGKSAEAPASNGA